MSGAHVHHWRVEPPEEATARQQAAGVPLGERRIEGCCACGERRCWPSSPPERLSRNGRRGITLRAR